MNDEKIPIEGDLYDACMLAKELVSDGDNPGLANYEAGEEYGYSASDVGWARSQLKKNYKIDLDNKLSEKYNYKPPVVEHLPSLFDNDEPTVIDGILPQDYRRNHREQS